MTTHTEVLSRYEDNLFGVPVVIRNCVIKETNERGEEFITIPDEEGLAAVIAMARALTPIKLSGADIRMMRKTLGMRAKDFAAAVHMSPARLSRLEKNADGLGAYTEVTIRQYVCARLKREAPAISYDPADLVTMRVEQGEVQTMEFERVRLKLSESQTKSDEWDMAA